MVLSLFRKKKEEKKEEVEATKKSIGTCIVCNNPILETEAYKTISFQNQEIVVHIRCLRRVRKLAIRYLKGDIKLPK